MRKVSLLLAFAVAGISGFAQYNTIKIEQGNSACSLDDKNTTSPKTSSASNEIKAPGDTFWEEDFTNEANGGDADAGWVYADDAGVGTFVYIDADTIFSSQSTSGGEAEPGVNMINGASPNGFLHLPIQYYNCIPGSWPRQVSGSPEALDASATSPLINVEGAPEDLLLTYKTLFRLCCMETETKLEVSIGQDFSGDGEMENWVTFNGRDLGGEVAINDWGSGDQIFNISAATVGVKNIKIMFRMYGGEHYMWSIDDVKIVEPHNNELSILDVYAAQFNLYTPGQLDNYNDANTNYSEVPSNIMSFMQFGALSHQAGLNAVNAKLDFSIDNLATGETDFETTSTGIIENFGADVTKDTILFTDTAGFGMGDFSGTKYFYNPDMSNPSNPTMIDGIEYQFNYELTNDYIDETSVDAIPENNKDSLAYAQTYGRYSYHWQETVGAEPRGDIGPFSYQSPTGVPGDIFANKFRMYVEDGDDFKVYGIRIFIPNDANVTFNESNDGVVMSPVIYFYDETAADGEGDYVALDVAGAPHQLTTLDSANYVYLDFDIDEVNAMDFPQGLYAIGVVIDDYKDQKVAVGVDTDYRQGDSHFLMKIDPYADSWYYWGTGGSAMIDAYTRLDQFQHDETYTGVNDVAKVSSNNVTVYPNPTTGIVNIKNVENSTISIYTITGNLVQTIENNDVNASINLAGLAKGYYLVKIVTENEVITKKINLK